MKYSKTNYSYVLSHFGNNLKYLELELYFLSMLRSKTNYDIIYMYSIMDTPMIFIDSIQQLNRNIKCVGIDDNNVTFFTADKKESQFKSGYDKFNTLRTCNFLFAYNLTQYDKICIVESDLIIMGNIDDIFNETPPSILYYHKSTNTIQNTNYTVTIRNDITADCNEKSNFNGGVMLIQPDSEKYLVLKILMNEIIKKECKFPNEILFALLNSQFYNLPIKYNFNWYHAVNNNEPFTRNHMKYEDIVIFHLSNAPSDYGHIDICKKGLRQLQYNKLNNPRIINYNKNIKTIIYFYNKFYKPNKNAIERVLSNVNVNVNLNNSNILSLNTHATLEERPGEDEMKNEMNGVKNGGRGSRKKTHCKWQ
jgi:alpha-N-acetylglucosamine transferase